MERIFEMPKYFLQMFHINNMSSQLNRSSRLNVKQDKIREKSSLDSSIHAMFLNFWDIHF